MKRFLNALHEQRWDDHRFYHQSRINQSLHFFSAICFLCSYVLLFSHPAFAVFVGWFLAMISRQTGHFFFEPKGYDKVNDVTHQYKEDVKVGYNLKRKIVLLTIWVLSPLVFVFEPSLFGLLTPAESLGGHLHNIALLWLGVASAGLLFRTVQLFFVRDVETGLVWFTKILTDPFHDVYLYYKAPLHVLRGELLDPMHSVRDVQQHAQTA